MRGGRAHETIQTAGVIHEYQDALRTEQYELADRIERANPDLRKPFKAAWVEAMLYRQGARVGRTI